MYCFALSLLCDSDLVTVTLVSCELNKELILSLRTIVSHPAPPPPSLANIKVRSVKREKVLIFSFTH